MNITFEKRFSFIDSVLDEEYESYRLVQKRSFVLPAKKTLKRITLLGRRKISMLVYRSYLFVWFALYYAVYSIGKIVIR